MGIGLFVDRTDLKLSKATTKGASAIRKQTTRRDLSPDKAKTLIEKSLDADKALDIVSIPLKGTSALADYIIVASGTSSRHVGALAEKLRERLSEAGYKDIRIEGQGQSDWVVVDTGDIIVHLFRPEVRSFYNIEKMWTHHAPLNVISQQVSA